MHITEAQHKVAGEFVDLIATAVGEDRAVHPETAIACAARLAGSLLWRSFNITLTNAVPGTAVLSHEANEKGPMLVGILSASLASLGINLDRNSISKAGKGEEPNFSVVEMLTKVQDASMRIAERNGLGFEEAAQSAAMATAFIVKECSINVSAARAFNTAVYGFIEGSKTIPPEPGTQPVPRKPWYKLWRCQLRESGTARCSLRNVFGRRT